MDLSLPTLEEHRRLYDAAAALKNEAPWEWMYEDEVFGVRNPETGEIGYVSIMGILGEHLALAVYLGSEGLHGFWRMVHGDMDDRPELPLEVPHLQASFEDRNMLHAKDREVIKALGLRFRGRQAWPMFRRFRPGCAPWFITSKEARFLAVAIEQGLAVIHRLEEDPDLLEPPDAEEYLVRIPAGHDWADEWLIPPPSPPQPLPTVDTKRLATLREQLPRASFTLEADLFTLPTFIKEKDDPWPYLPYVLLVVEAESGLIVGHELMIAQPSLEVVWRQTQASLLDTLSRLQNLPNRLAIRDERLFNLLMPLAAGLGIQLERARRLPALDEARAVFEHRMG